MKMNSTNYELELQEDMLATLPGDKELYSRFVASNAPDAMTFEEEVEEFGVDDVTERGMTVFPRLDDGTPFLYDYQVKGYLKGACSFLRNVKGSECSKVKAFKKKIDGLVFVFPRKIPIDMSDRLSVCQRPLRASTPQGDRVALASSEAVPAGSKLRFSIKILDESLQPMIDEIMEYGELSGIGCWRNSGKGRFTYTVVE